MKTLLVAASLSLLASGAMAFSLAEPLIPTLTFPEASADVSTQGPAPLPVPAPAEK